MLAFVSRVLTRSSDCCLRECACIQYSYLYTRWKENAIVFPLSFSPTRIGVNLERDVFQFVYFTHHFVCVSVQMHTVEAHGKNKIV